MRKKSKGKRFANQAEEAAWWEANELAMADEFEKLMTDDRRGPANLIFTGDSTVGRVRLGAKDVVKLRTQARERAMRCQEYLKMIIHEALRNAEQKKGSDAA